MSFFFLYMFIVLVFWRPQEWLFPFLFGIPLLQGITYAAILAMMMEYQSGRLRMNFKEPQYFLYMGLFVAGCMSHISWWYWEGLMNNWMTIFRLSFFGILLFACCSSPRHLRWIARAFVIMALLMSFHAILQSARGYGFAGHRPVMSWRPDVTYLVPRTRFFGIFNDPNDMGQFFATAMPLCFVFFKKQNILTIFISIGMIVYLYMGFATTLSRGSQVGMLASVGVAGVMLIFKRRYLPILLLGLIAALMLIPLSGRFLGEAWERVDLWGQANWAFRTKPIFGVGLGMHTDYMDQAKVAHNAFVSAYTEIGVFGFFFWMTLIWVAAVGLMQTRSALWNIQDSEGQYLHRFSLWGLSAFAGFCASAFFLSRSFIFPLFFLTAMFGAVPYLAKWYVRDEEDKPWLGMTIRDVTILGIPISLLTIVYIYVTILILNLQR